MPARSPALPFASGLFHSSRRPSATFANAFVCALLICRTGIAKEGAIDLMQASGGENSPAAGLPLTNELKRGH